MLKLINWDASQGMYQMYFQDSANFIMRCITYLHDAVLSVILIGILASVGYWLFIACFLFNHKNNKGELLLLHANKLEIIWTIIPSLILVLIAIPSFSFLFQIERLGNPIYTIKVIGHQWYWSYEFLLGKKEFDFTSIMVSTEDLNLGELRLLEVDNPLVLPVYSQIRFLITSSDVLHCWAIPSLGIKVDACPGRLNQISTKLLRTGVFYGQCSEICGVNHGFMPIKIVGVAEFLRYILFKANE